MRPLKNGYQGLEVLFELNSDLLLFATTIGLALLATGYILTL